MPFPSACPRPDAPGASACPDPLHLAALLDRAVARWGEHTFLRDARTGRALTFHATREQATRLAEALRARGVRPGDRVVVVAENRIEVPLLVFATARLGAIFCVLHEGIAQGTATAILARSEPRVVVLAGTQDLARTCGAGEPVSLDALCSQAGRAGEMQNPEPYAGAADDLAGLVFTSGSTGEPKGVAITHRNVLFTAGAIQDRLRYRPGDVVGLLLPFSFDYGLYQVFLAAFSGASVLVADARQVGPGLVPWLRKEGVTILPVVPTLLSAMLVLLGRAPGWLPALRCITSTGESCPQAHLDRIATLLPQVEVCVMYGLTECKRVSVLLPEEAPLRPGSVGRPLDGVEVRIVDDLGTPVPADTPGRIRVRGPNVAAGYWRDPEETRRRFSGTDDHQRELDTGDYGWVDCDGFLYVQGRCDGVMKHRGFRMAAAEVESAARELDGVVDAALVRVNERDELHLFLATGRTEVLPGRVAAELAKRLEAHKVPERVHCLGALPILATGKVDRERLLALTRTGEGG